MKQTTMNLLLDIVIFVFASTFLVVAQNDKQWLIDHYTNLITNRTRIAAEYQFPTDARMYEATDTSPEDFGTFDFIVIGAGTAGCVIANRLSEIPTWKVLLLEAGSYRDEELTGMPAMYILDVFSKFNWGFYSIPQNHGCLGNSANKCFIPRGKGMGGSTLINGLLYTRGDKLDFQRWSNLLNDPTWNYPSLLPYFKKEENFTWSNRQMPIDVSFHGFNGPLHSTQCIPPQSVSNILLQGATEFGYDIVDYNGRQKMGASVFQVNTLHGKRFDANMAYVRPAKSRSNLLVLDGSYVTKIDINRITKHVRGVVFTRGCKTYTATIRKEVILSAGAISSPQILMLSGVGPQEHLNSVGIPVIKNLPVGKTLRDHVFTSLAFNSNFTDIEPLTKSITDFINGEGLLTRSVTWDGVNWFKTPKELNPSYSDIEFFYLNMSGSIPAQRFFGWSDEVFNALNPNVSNPFYIVMGLLHSKSNGTVELNNSDPFEYPLINPNLLSDPANDDIETLYQGIQMMLRLIETNSFRRLGIKLASNRFPGCNQHRPLSRDYWYCYLRKVSFIGSHQVGTCLTGTSPETGVVDKNLKVFGIKGLRVADASVIPFTITGHTNAATNMVGERASDIIKEAYGIS